MALMRRIHYQGLMSEARMGLEEPCHHILDRQAAGTCLGAVQTLSSLYSLALHKRGTVPPSVRAGD